MATLGLAASPHGASPGQRRSAEDLALDVSNLMDGVREEVMALMLESMQKTASFCASLCAERIVAARREMQARWAAERRELERLYGIASPSKSGFAGASSPRRYREAAAEQDFAHTPAGPAASSKASLAGSVAGSLAGSMLAGSLRGGPLLPGVAAAATAPKAMGATSSLSQGMNGLGGLPIDSYDSSFIDAFDAVQTLEERTSMAARAMDLLDEALQAAEIVQSAGPPLATAGLAEGAQRRQADAAAAPPPPPPLVPPARTQVEPHPGTWSEHAASQAANPNVGAAAAAGGLATVYPAAGRRPFGSDALRPMPGAAPEALAPGAGVEPVAPSAVASAGVATLPLAGGQSGDGFIVEQGERSATLRGRSFSGQSSQASVPAAKLHGA